MLIGVAIFFFVTLAGVTYHYSSFDELAFSSKPTDDYKQSLLLTAQFQKALIEGNETLLNEILDEDFEDDDGSDRLEFINRMKNVQNNRTPRDRNDDAFIISSADTAYSNVLKEWNNQDRPQFEIEVDSVVVVNNERQIVVSFKKMKLDRNDPSKSRMITEKGSLTLKKNKGRWRFNKSKNLGKFISDN
jgi:hypothetical protein